MYFDIELLKKWKKRDYTMLTNANVSDYLKDILVFKASNRKPGQSISDQRFFGEAYVATQIPMIHGWYNSYQWLRWKGNNGMWLTGKGLKQKNHEPVNFHKIFYNDAICEHIKLCNLQYLHGYSQKYQCNDQKTKKYPKAPDLFIIDKQNNFIFIEVKLPRDDFDPLQDIGLKIIRNYLKTEKEVSIIVRKLKLKPYR